MLLSLFCHEGRICGRRRRRNIRDGRLGVGGILLLLAGDDTRPALFLEVLLAAAQHAPLPEQESERGHKHQLDHDDPEYNCRAALVIAFVKLE
jgi:hypothetical protein